MHWLNRNSTLRNVICCWKFESNQSQRKPLKWWSTNAPLTTLIFFIFLGQKLSSELDMWLSNANATHSPAKAVIAP